MVTFYEEISLDLAENDAELKTKAEERVCYPIYTTGTYMRLIVRTIVGRRQIFLRNHSVDRLLHKDRSKTF